MSVTPDMAQESRLPAQWAEEWWPALVRSMLPVMLALALVGCRLPSQEGLKNATWDPPQTDKEQSGAPSAGQGLIKPVIPLERQTEAVSPPQKAEPPQPIRVVVQPEPESKPQKNDWEDQKVKSAAMEMAKASPSVRKMKICYEVKHDEWWVILYEDNGPAIELKQLVWNRSQERFEPHLVVERISRDQLEKHVAESEPGRACEAVDVAPKR